MKYNEEEIYNEKYVMKWNNEQIWIIRNQCV